MKTSALVSLSTFRSTADAQIAKGILDEAGIDSMIRADNAGGCIQQSAVPNCWSGLTMSSEPVKPWTN